jgi:hypothetical protein
MVKKMNASPVLVPAPHRGAVLDFLRNRARPPFGQAATVELRGRRAVPQVRTVLFYYVEELDCIAFCTGTKTKKWAQLKKNPALSGCFYDAERTTQYRWECRAETAEASSPRHGLLVARLWRTMSADLRRCIWEDHNRSVKAAGPIDIEVPCPSEGVVICRPDRWDIFRLEFADFKTSVRTVSTRSGNRWTSRSAPIHQTAQAL